MNGVKFGSKFLTFLFLLSACLIVALPASAQTTAISGKVVDQGGAVIPGVTVTLTSSTGATLTTLSNDVGAYQFLQLKPGKYSIKAELPGFKTAMVQGLNLLVDTPMTLDLTLEVGQITEMVTVEASAAKLNTQDATLGNAFENQRIVELPLESRNVANLLSLQAAVTPDGYVSGSRSDQSNLTLDGIDVNDQQTGAAFSSVLRITPDSVQEFRVTTNTPTAAQGRSSGGQVSLVTKTGTNEFHGSLYEFHRNTLTTANDFFNNRVGIDTPKLLRNLFGGSIGGPIVKDRAFFFYNYEGRRDAKETSILRTVPTASLGQGIVKYQNTAGGITSLTPDQLNSIYPVGVNPLAIAALNEAATKYPVNDDGVGDGLNIGGYRFNAPLPLAQNAHTATLDFNLTQDGKHTLMLRGNYQYDMEAGSPMFPDTPGTNTWSHPIGFMAQHTWTATPKLINTFRAGLTREAFTQQGDLAGNDIGFRFVFYPLRGVTTTERITPVWNFVDDLAWVHGNHTWQFGTNVRIIRNERTSFGSSYDDAITNPSFYQNSGAVLTSPLSDVAGNVGNLQGALAAVIGRYSEYTANFNFDRAGNLLPSGEGILRDFGTEEYEFYAQDAWRMRPDFTLTLGLRYSLNTPVYETNGMQVSPTVSLGDYFEKRKESAANGVPYNEPFTVDLSGPVNGKPGFYSMDKNNFAPRASFAWSPSFDGGILHAIFGGGEHKSVFRGGFAMSYDQIGNALAVSFDLNNSLGFSSSDTLPANTYNVTDRPGPLFTGYSQDVRSLPNLLVPDTLQFPLMTPADGRQRIEMSLDDTLTTPANYNWNFSIGREFGGGLTIEASYVGRMARNLLATRDVMALNDLVDSKSGMDWYTAANMLYDARWNNVPVSDIAPIPYFENLFPNFRDGDLTATQTAYQWVAREAAGGWNVPDWTYLQLNLDDAGIYQNAFFQPQYGALSAWSTIANSDYHAATLSIKERFQDSLNFDFNYTFGKSIDNASGLQTSGSYGSGFITNPLRPNDNRSVSDFDIKHMVNANMLWQMPFGRGRTYLNDMPAVLNHVLGGWQLTSIFRWNSGLPESAPFDANIWATNWNVQSWGSLIRPLEAAPTKSGDFPNFFADPTYAYQSFRNARPGETGQRNIFRRQSYVSLDFGLGKSFAMPWAEGHRLQFRWEVFNATNTQRLGDLQGGRGGYGLDIDPQLGMPGADFGKITSIQGSPRVMQFALRYDF